MAVTSNEYAVIEAESLSGVTPATTYFATKQEALDYADTRATFFTTTEVVKVIRRLHTVQVLETSREE